MRLTGKSVLVTGGATGIGLELAAQLADRGNDVVICGRRRSRIDAALGRIRGGRGLACDLSEDSEIVRLVEFIRSEVGTLDVLVNNAGVQVQTDLAEGGLDFADLRTELETNLGAPIKLTRAFLPMLLQRPQAAIVNISSLLGIMPKPNAPGYCASKAGLHVLSEALRLRLAGTPVTVSVVLPPLVDTPMTRGRGVNKMPADLFAREVLRQLEQARFEIRVGQARTLMTLNRLSPSIAAWWTRRVSAGRTQPEHDAGTAVGQ